MIPDKQFREQDPEEMRAFAEKQTFATLVAAGPDGRFVATHLPLLIQEWGERTVFRGHVMLDADHGQVLQHAKNVLVTFLGPDAPVLGSWQSTMRFGGTWNYQALHVQGRVEWRDRETLVEHLRTLKNRFETSPDHRFASLPADYVDGLLPHIGCFDIVAMEMSCIFKLSQNRLPEEFDRTARELRLRGGKSALVAAEMERQRGRYFPEADGPM
jgi:transcriptional regulator